MSYKLVDAAFYFGSSPTEKAVLLALCKHANHDGTNSFASVAMIADETALSERIVQRALRALEKRKYGGNYILATSGKKGGWKKQTVNYKILLPLDDIAAAVKQSQTGDGQSPLETDGCQSDTPTGDTQSARVTDSHPTGDTVTPESVLESVSESVLSESVHEEGRTVIPPPSFSFEQDMRELQPILRKFKECWKNFWTETLPAKYPRVHRNQVKAWEEQAKKFQQFSDQDYRLLKGMLEHETVDELLERWEHFIGEKDDRGKGWDDAEYPFRIFARQ